MLDYKGWHGITVRTLCATQNTNVSCHTRTVIRNTRSLPSVGNRYNACITTVKKKLAEENVFIYSLIYSMILLVSSTVEHHMNDTACSVKQSWPILMYYPCICLETLKKTVN